MSINKNQKDFPSTAHKSIWHTCLFMSPFYEVIPTDIEGDKKKHLVKGERDFYDFMTALYLEMYNNPEKFYIPTIEYDRYMKGRIKEELPHKNDPKECSLRNRFQHSIKFYQDFFYELGKVGEIDSLSSDFIFTEKEVVNILNKFKILKNDDNKLDRIDSLKSIGFDYKKANKKIIFFNKKYPLMFYGLLVLSQSKNKKYGYTCYLSCDYRGIDEAFELKFEDTVLVLNEKYKEIAYEMNELMNKIEAKLKVKPMRSTLLHSIWKLQYTKKSKAVYTMHIDIDNMSNFLNFNNIENISRLGYLLKKRSVELYNWFYEHIITRECSCKNNRIVDIGGRKKRICGLMNRVDIYNPKKLDLERMKYLIDIYHIKKVFV